MQKDWKMKNPTEIKRNINVFSPRHAGGAFTLAVLLGLFANLVLSLIVTGIAETKGITFDQALQTNGVIWLSYLFPQIVLLGVAIGVMVYAKVPPTFLSEKPKVWHIGAAVLLWFGLLFGFGFLNAYFIKLLQLFGYTPPEAFTPVMNTVWQYVISVIVIAVLPAIAEELLFRGVLLSGTRGAQMIPRMLFCGALFCVFHQNPMQTPYQFLCGCTFVYFMLKTGNFYLVTFIHFANNFYILSELYFQIPAFAPWLKVVLSVIGLLAFVGGLFLLYRKGDNREGQTDSALAAQAPVKTAFLWSFAGLFACVIMWISNLIAGFGG